MEKEELKKKENEELIKEKISLKEKNSKRLLELKFQEKKALNRIKMFKMDCKKNSIYIVKQEKHAIRNKTNKNGSKAWNNVFFGTQRLHP